MSCLHKNIELRYRKFPKGKSYCEQCLDCGEMIKQEHGGYYIAVKDLAKEDINDTPEFINFKRDPDQLELEL
jgi:hypothetical protein